MSTSRFLGVLALALVVLAGLMTALTFISDRNKHTPELAFNKCYRGMSRDGVTELQVAGRWWERGQPSWFRFKATPEALERVSSSFNPLPFSRLALLARKPKWDQDLRRHDPRNRLRWHELYTKGALETSERLIYNNAQMWVDRKSNTVFVYCPDGF